MKERTTLDHDLKHTTFSSLILIDTDGVEAREMVDFLESFAERFSYTLYHIRLGCYLLRDHDPFPNHARFESEIEILLSESSESLTLGISLERQDALEKAEKALTFAKRHGRRMIADSRMIENALMAQADTL